jgi:hypothetical protein
MLKDILCANDKYKTDLQFNIETIIDEFGTLVYKVSIDLIINDIKLFSSVDQWNATKYSYEEAEKKSTYNFLNNMSKITIENYI